MQDSARKANPLEIPSNSLPRESSVASAFVDYLARLGVQQAFGVSGGAIAMFFDALAEGPIELYHFRHETGAAFAAAEAYFATGMPSVVFSTTGPGTLNALNGIMAAKWDGAKVILVSGATNSAQRGRWATQETSTYTFPQDAIYSSGPIFDFAVRMESASEFPEVTRRLSLGLSRPGGFVAHVCLPIQVQSRRVDLPARWPLATASAPAASHQDVAQCAARLESGTFAVWAGFGALEAAPRVRALIEKTGVRLFCSARAKGILPENHPQFLGVTGLGGHEEVGEYMVLHKPDWVLVLGSRLGEATSFWDRDMVPEKGFIHVDLDPQVPGTAYPESYTIGIQAEVGEFLEDLLPLMPRRPAVPLVGKDGQEIARDPSNVVRLPFRWREELGMEREGLGMESVEQPATLGPARPGRVRPQILMEAIQRHVVDHSDALVMGECGNSFAWCNHLLHFPAPGRYRVSPRYGSMGHCAAGVVGASLARDGKAVAVVGDGSMLMNSEISTAVQYGAPAVWIVLNDAAYGMCRDGHQVLGLSLEETALPQVDFVGMARSMGADGMKVSEEEDLDAALLAALDAKGPFVVDVVIDPEQASPLLKRFESLIRQGNSKNVAGWEV